MSTSQKTIKIAKPQLLRGIEDRSINELRLEDESVIENIYITDCEVEVSEASSVNFEGVVFSRVDFNGVKLESLELTDVRFENCDLSNADFSGAIIHRTEFVNCKLIGLKLNDSSLQNVHIENSNGKFVLMNYGEMKNVVITDSIFENSSFQYCKLNKVSFRRCDFKLSQMSGTSLNGMDIGDCEFEGVNLSIDDIKGAIVSPMQAVDFSKLIGLIIKE